MRYVMSYFNLLRSLVRSLDSLSRASVWYHTTRYRYGARFTAMQCSNVPYTVTVQPNITVGPGVLGQ